MRLSRTVLMACLAALAAGAAVANEARTVIGPSNVALAEGAAALMAGDAEEGVRLTERGLSMATSHRDRLAGWTNLCAGYVMLNRLDEALEFCNQAIEADPEHWRALSNRALVYLFKDEFDLAGRDIARAEAIAPRARIPREVRAMLRDAMDPVVPTVTIDDRRRPPVPEPAD